MRIYEMASDSELINAYQNGDIPAFETLINRYKDRIFSSILFFVKDHYLAEDIFQDVFIKIIDTFSNKRYQEEGKFLPWALRIAHNLCVDYYRKVKRGPIIKTSEDTDIFEVINVVEPSAETNKIRRQTQEQIRNLIDLLPDEQREIIVLRHYAELSFKEIAFMTNCSINTALGRMRYALINLRKMIQEKQILQ